MLLIVLFAFLWHLGVVRCNEMCSLHGPFVQNKPLVLELLFEKLCTVAVPSGPEGCYCFESTLYSMKFAFSVLWCDKCPMVVIQRITRIQFLILFQLRLHFFEYILVPINIQ